MTNEFRCNKCLQHKKIELLAYTEQRKGTRHTCTACAKRIDEAADAYSLSLSNSSS